MVRFGLKSCAFLFSPEKKAGVCQWHLSPCIILKCNKKEDNLFNCLLKDTVLLDLAFFLIHGEHLWHCYSNNVSESLNRWFSHWLG